MITPRALLANEAGGGRGHVTTLRAAAKALGPDVRIIAALARQHYADELADLCEKVVKAPLLARPVGTVGEMGLPGSATWGDVLAAIGLASDHKIRRGLAFWRKLIVDEDISLLIADFSPLALRAALGLRDEGWAIRIISIGTGYLVPPAHIDRFPLFLNDYSTVFHSEAATLTLLNAVGAESGLAPLPRLAALYDVDLSLVTTFDFLDPYGADRDPEDLTGCHTAAPQALAGEGTEVFVYFSTDELTDDALVVALEGLSLPRRGYVPSASPEVRARLAASGMTLLDHPASADEIARRSRLIVHAAPHGTVCLAALCGLPQVGVPQHLEQLFNARCAEAKGILRIGRRGDPGLGAKIAAAYADVGLRDRALAVATELRRDYPGDPQAVLAARLARQVQAARDTLA
ncbi:hypothetical protein [Tabrizicola sp.]|uniref:glycosyltransferase n=1 Tax=Tabrizicola sp. TaxID=2005166 RepID=UPI00286B65E3|nr:hypothetical protein [Tabrizicola sp.]